MAIVEVDKFSINKFWETTPVILKYMITVALIVVGSYYLFSKTVTIGQIKQLDKIEETIGTTKSLIVQFQDFERAQYAYNAQTLIYLKNIYSLVQELNENTNRKFDVLLKSGGKNTEDIIEKILLLNESFEKLQKAYTPEEVVNAPGTVIPSTSIGVRKKENDQL